jgi:hypothetical protein
MISMGRYDVFDKWNMVCRSWAGEGPAIDVGVDRHGRPLLSEWRSAAFRGVNSYYEDYIRLKCEALTSGIANAETGAEGDDGDLNGELSRLLQEIGYPEFRARSLRLLESLPLSGPAALSNGELPPCVADRLKEVFKLGALLALRWTEDIGEIPDIEILRSKARAFPSHAIKGKRNVLSMFCVREYGVIDVIHIHDAAPDRVTLVDLDEECLDVVRRIYPREWTYIHADYKEFLREAEERGLEYDLIVADAWRAMCPEVGFDMFPTIMARCSDTFVAHYVKEMFEELGVGPDDLEGLSRSITRRTGVDVVATESLQRGSENWWLVLRKRTGLAAQPE